MGGSFTCEVENNQNKNKKNVLASLQKKIPNLRFETTPDYSNYCSIVS